MRKSIKMASGQIKHVELNGTDDHSKVWEIFKEHRSLLVDGIVASLETYVDFRHPLKKASREQLLMIKGLLVELRDSNVPDRYSALISSTTASNQEICRLSSEPFLNEINDVIGAGLTLAVSR